MGSQLQFPCPGIDGAEIILGVDGYEAGERLKGIVALKPVLNHILGYGRDIGGKVECSVFLDKMPSVVI